MVDAAIAKPIRRPRFRRCDIQPAFQLTERDIEIVRKVARHRFLRSTHISRLVEGPHKKICERLTLLFHAGYLDRPRAQLEYNVRGGGSTHCVYALGNRGARLLKERDSLERSNIDWARKNPETRRQFLMHTLAIADFRVALAIACRTRPDLKVLGPDELLNCAPAATRQDRNPWSWRVRVANAGRISDIGVRPDYVFALILPDGRRRPFAVECDRGTMPIERTSFEQTSILRKVLAYETSRKQGLLNLRFGWKNFRVLVCTSSRERVDNMRGMIGRTPPIADSPLFLFIDLETLMRANFFSHSWCRTSGARDSLCP